MLSCPTLGRMTRRVEGGEASQAKEGIDEIYQRATSIVTRPYYITYLYRRCGRFDPPSPRATADKAVFTPTSYCEKFKPHFVG